MTFLHPNIGLGQKIQHRPGSRTNRSVAAADLDGTSLAVKALKGKHKPKPSPLTFKYRKT